MAIEAKEFENCRPHSFIDRKIRELTLAFNADHVHGNYEIRVSKDEMEAWLITEPPRNGKMEVDMEVINTLIKENKISYGMVEDIEEIIPREMKAETLIARGRMPVSGEDAKLRMLYEESEDDSAGDKKPEGKVDHREITEFSIVGHGEPIVMKIPALEPITGVTVTGKRIPAKKGKDISLMAGRNVELSDDGNCLVSTAEGMVVRHNSMYEVVSVYLVEGDVDYSTGNINFGGCVKVKGNVLPGFKIIATESIEVEGTVERANLEAGMDIRLHKGYYGDENCRISAGEDIYARSFENARVRAGGKITAAQYIVNSEITAGGDIVVEHASRGRICGGHVRAGGNVISCDLGSASYANTLIEIGLPDFTNQDRNDKFNLINFYMKNLKSINGQIRKYMHVKKLRKLTFDQVKKLDELKEKSARHKNSLDVLVSRYGMPEILVKTPSLSNEVRVLGTAFAGVRVSSNGSILIFSEDYQEVVVKKKETELIMTSLDECENVIPIGA